MALALIGIATIELLYLLDNLYSRKVATGSSSAGAPWPDSSDQRNSAARSSTGPVESRTSCVNYEKFTTESGFDPSTLVTPDTMFRTMKRLVFFIGHARSGSSMIGRLLDAHPHMIVTNEVHSCVYFNFVTNI